MVISRVRAEVRRVARLTPILAAIAVVVCTGIPQSARAQMAAPGSKGEIRIALASIKQLGDLPQLTASKLLAEAGYTVSFQELNGNDQVVQAILRGEADFGDASATSAMTAISKGADLRIIAETARMDYVLATKASITSVDQLNGARVGIFSTVSDTNICLQITLRGRPNIKPQLLTGGFSSARVQAMLAGQMDASVIQLTDWLQLQSKGGSGFSTLQNYAKDLPDILSRVIYAKTSLLKEKPQLINDYLKAQLRAARQLKQGGAAAVETAIREQLPKVDPAQVPAIAKSYTDSLVWPTDGGLSTRSQDSTFQALSETGFISSEKKPFFDRTALDQVLKEMGS